jgi:FMN phosphatase YigB (HAD superfamily)
VQAAPPSPGHPEDYDGTPLGGKARTMPWPCQPVLDLAARARAADMLVGVLSNSWDGGGYDAYAGYDLEERFDTVVISDQVGMGKPDEAIYRLAADNLGAAPEECVFVDDNSAYLVARTGARHGRRQFHRGRRGHQAVRAQAAASPGPTRARPPDSGTSRGWL